MHQLGSSKQACTASDCIGEERNAAEMEMTVPRRHLSTQSPNSALAQVTYAGDKPAVPAASHALGHVLRRNRYASLAAPLEGSGAVPDSNVGLLMLPLPRLSKSPSLLVS